MAMAFSFTCMGTSIYARGVTMSASPAKSDLSWNCARFMIGTHGLRVVNPDDEESFDVAEDLGSGGEGSLPGTIEADDEPDEAA